MINKDQFTPQAWLRTPEDMGVANHIKKRYEDTQEESAVREWTGKDSIVTQKSLQSTPLTPEQAGEEDGWLDKMLDGTSDAVVGLYRGIGYGADEIAVSASELANMFTEEDTTYQAKYISKYMDTMKRKGVAGDVAESIGQFMIGWMPWTRGIGLMAKGMQGVGLTKKAGVALAGGSKAGRISSNFIASSLTGGTAFSPDHESMVDALTTLDRKSQGAIARILATNPNDPDWKNRARHALTDGLGSLAGDLLLVPAVKGVGGAIAGVAKDPLDKFIQGLHTYTHKVAKDVSDRYGVLGRGKTHVYVEDGTTKFRNADGNVQLDEFADKMKMPNIKPNGDNAESVLRQMEKDGSLDAKFAEARTLEEKSLLADQIAEQLGRKRNLKLGSVEVGNIKWNKGKGGGFHTTVDGKKWSIKHRKKDGQWVLKQGKSLRSVHPSKEHAQKIMAEEAGVDLKKTVPRRTHEQLFKESQKLFDEVGIDAQAIKNLPDNMGWNDTQMFTFAKLVQTTQKEMIDALKRHATTPTTDTSHKLLEGQAISAIANHADALTFLEGAKTSVARSMKAIQGVNKMVNSTVHADHIGSPEIAKLIKSSNIGGADIGRMTQMILHAYETNGAKKGAKALIEGVGNNEGGGWNQFVEAWINQGLLSNPATHALNAFSGLSNIVGHVASQTTAAFISKLPFVENKVLFREAFGSMYGLVAGLTKAFRMSFRAGMTGTQMVTKGAKIENYGMKHIAAQHVGKGMGGAEDTAIGLGVDFLGMLTRAPGRFLLLEDEFVKSVAYDMNLHSRAWKYAWSAQGKNNKGWLTTRRIYRDIVENPKQFVDDIGDIHADSQDLANMITFQRDVGDTVNSMSGIMQRHPYFKIFVPFLKVLTNIPKYVVQHSPLGLGFQNQAFKSGGTPRMLEMGRMAYGTMMMMYGAHLYNTGVLKSTGTRDFQAMMNKQSLGTDQEMSLKLKIGDTNTFVNLSRFAPVVNILGLGGDIAKGMNTWEQDPEDYVELISQAGASLQKNLVSATWAPNLHKLIGVMAEPREQGKQWSRAINSFAGTLQPAFIRAHEQYKHPELTDVSAFGLNREDLSTSTRADWSKIGAKLLSVSSHNGDQATGQYPKRNVLSDIVRHHDQIDEVPGFMNDPRVSFLTFKKANDNKVLKHLFGGSDEKTQLKEGADLELPIHPQKAKIKIGTGVNQLAYKLTPKELDHAKATIGKIKNPETNQTLLEAWTSAFNNPMYKDLPSKSDGTSNKERLMMRIYSKYKKLALNDTIHKFGLINKAVDLRKEMTTKIRNKKSQDLALLKEKYGE